MKGARITGIGSTIMDPSHPDCLVRLVTNQELTNSLAERGRHYREIFRTLRAWKNLREMRLHDGREGSIYNTGGWEDHDDATKVELALLWLKYKEAPIPEDDDPCWKQFDTSPEDIFRLTGIEQRYWAKPGVATSDLATQAAEKALAISGLDRNKVQFIIVATTTPDHPQTPPTASLVAKKLGIAAAGPWCLDVTSACTSFVSAVGLAYGLIRSGVYKFGLVIGADVMGEPTTSRCDRNVRIVLGDGGHAIEIEACPEKQDAFRPEWFSYSSDVSMSDLIVTPAGGSALEITPLMLADPFDQRHRMFMNGREVRKRAERLLLETQEGANGKEYVGAVAEAVARAGIEYSDIALAVFHQANIRIIDPVVKKLRLLGCRAVVHNNIAYYGNTTSPSSGICLDEAWQADLVKEGDLVMVVSMGGGLGTAIYFYKFSLGSYPSHILPVSFIHLPVAVPVEA